VKRFDLNLFPNFFVYSDRWIRHSIKRAASRFDIVYCPNKSRVIYAEPAEIGEEQEVEETPEDTFFANEVAEQILIALEEFPDREKDVIMRIFGLGNTIPQTLREIGPLYGVSHERVRQIKERVVEKLRDNSNLNELR
jgi:RNA polymerase sigma factor (sigma-70 family)